MRDRRRSMVDPRVRQAHATSKSSYRSPCEHPIEDHEVEIADIWISDPNNTKSNAGKVWRSEAVYHCARCRKSTFSKLAESAWRLAWSNLCGAIAGAASYVVGGVRLTGSFYTYRPRPLFIKRCGELTEEQFAMVVAAIHSCVARLEPNGPKLGPMVRLWVEHPWTPGGDRSLVLSKQWETHRAATCRRCELPIFLADSHVMVNGSAVSGVRVQLDEYNKSKEAEQWWWASMLRGKINDRETPIFTFAELREFARMHAIQCYLSWWVDREQTKPVDKPDYHSPERAATSDHCLVCGGDSAYGHSYCTDHFPHLDPAHRER